MFPRACFALLAAFAARAAPPGETCTFAPSAADADITSPLVGLAGVFSSSGQLLKQVFSSPGGEEGRGLHPRLGAGDSTSASFTWDASLYPPGAQLRAFTSAAPSYDWMGVVGNNGQNEGFFVWQGLSAVEDMTIIGNKGVFVEGYAELSIAMKVVNMSETTSAVPVMHSDYHR